MKKTNIAELLKGCPNGMDLDCATYDNVQFDIVQDGNAFPIKINTPEGRISLSKYGCYSQNPQCKCVIFPKGKTTWEGFVPPCKFKVGDKVVFNDAKEKPLTIRKIWWDWQAKEILCSFEEDDIDVPVKDLDRYIKPKFDITTLKPFDKVLVRGSIYDEWKVSLWGCISDWDRDYKYDTVRGYYKCCIPYESNEHLLGKADDCDEYYKNWE